jgi:hypothetical protein
MRNVGDFVSGVDSGVERLRRGRKCDWWGTWLRFEVGGKTFIRRENFEWESRSCVLDNTNKIVRSHGSK